MNYKYEILIKSGTGQYYDYGNCDCLIKKCETPFLPRIGETIQINFNKINENTGKKCIQYYKFLVVIFSIGLMRIRMESTFM